MATISAALLLGTASAASSQTASQCRIERWRTTPEAPNATTTITLQRGSSCAMTTSVRDATYVVTTPPRAGRVTVSNGIIVYQPREGYVGNDAFVVEWTMAASDATTGRRTLAVSAAVQRDPVVAATPAPAARAPAPPSGWPACQVDSFTVGGPAAGEASSPWNSNAANPTMRLRSGGSCSFTMIGPGGSMSVTAPPRNGNASVDGARVTYRANPGFSGSDTFSVRLFRPSAAPEYATRFVYVNVEVR